MYELLLIPILIGIITQAIKLTIDGIPNNFTLQDMLNNYGGMPSSHTALVTSLAMIVGLNQGFGSAAFAVAFILMVIVIRDAVGFRREIGRNSAFTNMVAKKVFKNKKINYLSEKIGHKISEVVAGFLIGIILTIIFDWLFKLI